jgi:hypothetical protein
MKKLIIILMALFISASILAQEEQKDETPYWYTSSIKIPWPKMDSLQQLYKLYTIPILEEEKKNGNILDYHILIHHTGDEYNVVTMTKFPSWTAIAEGVSFAQLLEKFVPDKDKRDEIEAAFSSIRSGYYHKDNIYIEVE